MRPRWLFGWVACAFVTLIAPCSRDAYAKCSGTAARCQSLVVGSMVKPIELTGIGTFYLDYRGSEYMIVFPDSPTQKSGDWQFNSLYALEQTLGLVRFRYNNEFQQSRVTIVSQSPDPADDFCPAVATHEFFFRFEVPALGKVVFNKDPLRLQGVIHNFPPYHDKFNLLEPITLYDEQDPTVIAGRKLTPDDTGIELSSGITVNRLSLAVSSGTFTGMWEIRNVVGSQLSISWFAFSTPSITLSTAEVQPINVVSPPAGQNPFSYSAITSLADPGNGSGTTFAAAGPSVTPHFVEHVPIILDAQPLTVTLRGSYVGEAPGAGISVHAVAITGPLAEGSNQTCFFLPGCNLVEGSVQSPVVPALSWWGGVAMSVLLLASFLVIVLRRQVA